MGGGENKRYDFAGRKGSTGVNGRVKEKGCSCPGFKVKHWVGGRW